MEISTREAYSYSIYKHLMPEFGAMRMIDILPEHVRAWVAKLQAEGVTAATIRYNRIILSAIFTTAMEDQVTFLHPCKGVRTPPVPKKPLQIITPEQFDLIYEALPTIDDQLLVETAVETGLRWGELTELRVKDLGRVPYARSPHIVPAPREGHTASIPQVEGIQALDQTVPLLSVRHEWSRPARASAVP